MSGSEISAVWCNINHCLEPGTAFRLEQRTRMDAPVLTAAILAAASVPV